MSDDKTSKTFTITQRNGTTHTVIVDANKYDDVIGLGVVVSNASRHFFYAVYRDANDKLRYLHHLIAGTPPKGMMVDHINGNTLDNRSSNLRICTRAENIRNRRTYGKSGYKGVQQVSSGRWAARCNRRYLGTFSTPELAHEAFCNAAKKLYGEFFNPGTHTTEAHQ